MVDHATRLIHMDKLSIPVADSHRLDWLLVGIVVALLIHGRGHAKSALTAVSSKVFILLDR